MRLHPLVLKHVIDKPRDCGAQREAALSPWLIKAQTVQCSVWGLDLVHLGSRGRRMSIFEPVEVTLTEGYWRVKVNVSSEAAEYISHDRALSLAEELEAEGWRECAAHLRKAAETAKRFQSYARP
jgi:hypothetical protein